MTFDFFFWTAISLQFFSNILRRFHFLSEPQNHSISSEISWDSSISCLTQKFTSNLQKRSKTVSVLVIAAKSLQFFRKILRQFQNLSSPQITIIVSKVVYDVSGWKWVVVFSRPWKLFPLTNYLKQDKRKELSLAVNPTNFSIPLR